MINNFIYGILFTESHIRDSETSGKIERDHWLPGYLGSIELEFSDYKDELYFGGEHQLSKEPLKMDGFLANHSKEFLIMKNIYLIIIFIVFCSLFTPVYSQNQNDKVISDFNNAFYSGRLAYYRGEYSDAFDHLQKASKEGIPAADYYLGSLYYHGWGVELSYEKAAEHYKKAADAGNVSAQRELWPMYFNGLGVEQSHEKAAFYYQKYMEVGDAKTLVENANRYRLGNGVEKSYEKAAEFYQLSADQDHSGAMHVLAWFYYNGQGVKQSYEKAFKMFELAAALGNTNSQYEVGRMYRDGIWVEKSYEKAMAYMQASADQNNGYGQYGMGSLYYNGWGVEQSYIQAANFYRLSANKGLSSAQYELGCMYRDGKGVEQSDEQALQLFQQAADQGYGPAKQALEELQQPTMTGELDEAESTQVNPSEVVPEANENLTVKDADAEELVPESNENEPVKDADAADLTINLISIPAGTETITADMISGAGNDLMLIVPPSVGQIDPVILEGRNVTIVGDTSSYAEQFAREYNIKFVTRLYTWLGD